MDDRQKELERIEEELLEELLREEREKEEQKQEAPKPAFENPDEIRDPEEPLVYCNFSNDYGKEQERERQEKAALRKKKKDEKIIIGLMLAVSVLCIGIIGVFIYWLETLLKLL